MIHLDYRDARPIYSQIMDGLKEQISAGILRQGDKLPSVRELAAQLTINPNTIQRAYRDLETQGWIASVPGKGSFVCHSPAPTPPRLAEFDTLVSTLLAMGIPRQELIDRIREGGNDHA